MSLSEPYFEYEETTHEVRVGINIHFLEEESNSEIHEYVWAYQVRIENLSENTIQLISRTWVITDAQGQSQVAQGEGVMGEQPLLNAMDGFEYVSSVTLHTSSGVMHGRYTMLDLETQEHFDVTIPAFSLDSPYQKQSVH